MRVLKIDDKARAEVARVLAYAKNHHYSVGQPVPGDNPEFVTHLDSYRCVFTFTEANDEEKTLFRHLSISVPGTKYPHPIAAFTIATLFGFTGWDGMSEDIPNGWIGGASEEDACVILLQPIEENRTLN